ncbi:hypothetical protein BDR06DRAFT_978025 [Suillus hirtellus]|nr:hypothetical protein BDR06DRAFT_978025 [Suillus hirtellus]
MSHWHPLLLSCATVIWQSSKGCTFESVPHWTLVADDDPRIKSHPQFKKTMDYCPPFVLNIPLPPHHLTLSHHQQPQLYHQSHPAQTWISLPGCRTKAIFTPTSTQEPSHLGRLAHPPLRYCHFYVTKAEWEQWKVVVLASNSKKRKADDEDMDVAVVIEAPKLPSSSQEPLKKNRMLMLNAPTAIIDSKPKSKPAEWNSEAHIATPYQAEQQPGLPADMQIQTLVNIGTSQQPEHGDQLALTNSTDSEPTARDILQGVLDLSRKFNLLATNERVDTLEVRLLLSSLCCYGCHLLSFGSGLM